MKKLTSFFSYAGTLSIALLLASGCGQPEAPGTQTKAPQPISAEKTSFQEVTSQLEPGGNLYVYLSTEQILEGLAAKVAAVSNLFAAIPTVKPEDQDKIGKAFDVVSHIIKDSGIEDVSGFGISAIATSKGFYHSKMLIHHYPGKGNGFLWKMFGEHPHALDGLSLLPANTGLALFSDLDIGLLWAEVRKQTAQAGIPEAEAFINKLPEQFERGTDLKWDTVLASLGGEFGLVLTLDDTRKITLPVPGEVLDIPEPGLMLLVKTKDDTIFNRLDEALKKTGQQVISADKPDVKMRTVPVPLPLPIQLRPTIASSGGYLFVASSDAVIQEALAVKAGQKPGLKSSEEFQKLSKEVPQQGNQFTFVSQRLGRTIIELQARTLRTVSKMASEDKNEWLQSLLDTNKATMSFSVAANQDDGWLTVANGNQHPAKVLLASTVVVPMGIMAAIAVPNFVKARQTSQKAACINNLRRIDGAKQQWAVEKNKSGSDVPSRTDLLPYLGDQFPVCPAGGRYTLNDVANGPQCSIPGHSLEEQ